MLSVIRKTVIGLLILAILIFLFFGAAFLLINFTEVVAVAAVLGFAYWIGDMAKPGW